MTLISAPGPILTNSRDDGFLLLRGLIVMFIVIICFAAVLAGISVFSHQSALLLERTEQEIQYRNEETMGLLK